MHLSAYSGQSFFMCPPSSLHEPPCRSGGKHRPAPTDLEQSNTTENSIRVVSGALFGRRDIFTAIDELTADNVVGEVNSALV